jgi:hypothetical protein
LFICLVQDPKRNPTTIYGLLAAASRSENGGRADDYDEIDQIYDYVRGFAPLPKTAKGWQYNSDGGGDEEHRRRSASAVLVLEVGKENKGGGHYGRIYAAKSENSENRPPEPPPIETIPSRRGGGGAINNNNNNINNKGGTGGSSPMELTPPVTPPFSPPWGSPVHGVTVAPLGPTGQLAGMMSGVLNSSPSHLIYER